MNPSQDFNNLYKDVSRSISGAIAEIDGLKPEHKDGKQELDSIRKKLGTIHARFNDELAMLDTNAEWDKFTIAFFGETNAGKSTIVESLRILFDEESRKTVLEENARNVTKYEKELAGHVAHVREVLHKVYAEYAAGVQAITNSIAPLGRVLKEESSARIRQRMWLCALVGVLTGGIATSAIMKIAGI